MLFGHHKIDNMTITVWKKVKPHEQQRAFALMSVRSTSNNTSYLFSSLERQITTHACYNKENSKGDSYSKSRKSHETKNIKKIMCICVGAYFIYKPVVECM